MFCAGAASGCGSGRKNKTPRLSRRGPGTLGWGIVAGGAPAASKRSAWALGGCTGAAGGRFAAVDEPFQEEVHARTVPPQSHQKYQTVDCRSPSASAPTVASSAPWSITSGQKPYC